ncbi:MAG: hypothetical protein LKE25_01935 [Lactobacillus sp.]|jgi:hypothetical protein|nr:hypothetical protein [Lactobacillus sp.]MCH3905761.1 hypothetical protein [Lactobacillus sp.]
MKKKLFAVLAALSLVFTLSACGQSKSSSSSSSNDARYARLMKQGKQEARDYDYDSAEETFERAQDVKNTSTARAYAEQADNMAEAKDDIKEYEFSDAKEALADAKNQTNGYSVMTDRAETLHSKISTVVRRFKRDINPLKRDAADAIDDGDYQSAIADYEEILDLPYINGKYYRKVKKQVQRLLARAQAKSSNQTSSNSSTNSAQGDPSQGNKSAPAGYVVGGQTVSMSARGQIRSRLTDLGYNQAQFTDDQVVGIFNTAYNNGHQSPAEITKDDVAQYLGQ